MEPEGSAESCLRNTGLDYKVFVQALVCHFLSEIRYGCTLGRIFIYIQEPDFFSVICVSYWKCSPVFTHLIQEKHSATSLLLLGREETWLTPKTHKMVVMTSSAKGRLLIYFVFCHCYDALWLSIAVEWLAFVLRV